MTDIEDELLTDEELEELLAEADAIERMPKPFYDYRDPSYRGGPRNVPAEARQQCADELNALRHVLDGYEGRVEAAKLLLYARMKVWLDAGMPVDWVAEHSGVRHRASALRAVRVYLPRLQEKRARALRLERQLAAS